MRHTDCMLTTSKWSRIRILILCWEMEAFLICLVNLTKQHHRQATINREKKGEEAGANHRPDPFTWQSKSQPGSIQMSAALHVLHDLVKKGRGLHQCYIAAILNQLQDPNENCFLRISLFVGTHQMLNTPDSSWISSLICIPTLERIIHFHIQCI